MKDQRFDRFSIPLTLRDFSKWPKVNPYSLQGRRRKIFLNRSKAVVRYIKGEKVNTICEECSIPRHQLVHLVKRCLSEHRDGQINGFRALLYYRRVEKYTRIQEVEPRPYGARGGWSGALGQLFEKYPSLKKYVNALFTKKKKELGYEVLETRMPICQIHKKLIAACRKKGISGNQYPFNSPSLGRKALGNYLRSLLTSRIGISARFGKEAEKKMGSDEDVVREYASKPYQKMEFDAHKLDASWLFRGVDRFGGFYQFVLTRIWILVLIDEYSGAIIAYLLCLKREYSQYDVMKLFKRAVEPWKPMEFSIPNMKYPQGGGLPSALIKAYEWATPHLVVYDNALANIAKWVRELLTNILGCVVNPGPVTTKDHQPFIESFFNTLASQIHRLPNATGFIAKNFQQNKPDEAALKFNMTVDHLREILESYIATYNATPHGGRDYRTPIEILELYAKRPDTIIKHLADEKKHELFWLSKSQIVTVKGSPHEGRRPFVNFYGVRYSSTILRNSFDLIGKQLSLVFDPTDDDIRTISAFLKTDDNHNGEFLCMLTAHGNWSISRHSLELRKQILKLRSKKEIFFDKNDDPIEVYLKFINEQAKKTQRARGRLAMAADQNAGPDPLPPDFTYPEDLSPPSEEEPLNPNLRPDSNTKIFS